MRGTLIVNKYSGGYSSRKLYTLLKNLNNIGLKVDKYELQKTQNVREIIDMLDPEKTPILLLAFGDGTINSAFNAIARRKDYDRFKICIVPMGTANVLGEELNINSVKKSIKAIKNNKIKKLHLGMVKNNIDKKEQTRYFSLMVSTGFDSLAVKRVDENLKNKIGKFAYIYEFLKIVHNRIFDEIQTIIDGNRYNGILACVNNGKYYGSRIRVVDSKLEDNSFNIIIIKKFSILSMIKYMTTKKSNSNVVKLKAKNILISTNKENYPIQIDGDYYCNLPIKVEATNIYINVFYL